MGVVVSHQFDGATRRDIMLFHKVSNLQVGFNLLSSFCGLSPGGVFSRGSPFSSFSGVSSVFRRVASLLVADKALSVSNVLRSFVWAEIDLVYVHGVRVQSRGSASRQDVAVPSSSEFPESHYILVEFSGFVKPLLPLPTSLPIGEGGSCYVFFFVYPKTPELSSYNMTHLRLLLIHHPTSFLLILFHVDSSPLTHCSTLHYINLKYLPCIP